MDSHLTGSNRICSNVYKTAQHYDRAPLNCQLRKMFCLLKGFCILKVLKLFVSFPSLFSYTQKRYCTRSPYKCNSYIYHCQFLMLLYKQRTGFFLNQSLKVFCKILPVGLPVHCKFTFIVNFIWRPFFRSRLTRYRLLFVRKTLFMFNLYVSTHNNFRDLKKN